MRARRAIAWAMGLGPLAPAVAIVGLGLLAPAVAIVGLGLLAPAVAAFVPSAEKIADEVASTNRADGRTDPLLLEVTMRIGESQPVATGVLASHPTGLARLELNSKQGFLERHLLQGSDYRASRDGRELRSPRPFLPPVFLLQAGSGAALRAALSSFGVSSGEVVLGMCGEVDCYVFGGRLPASRKRPDHLLPSLWVDMESFEVLQIDRADGVRFRFGPQVAFGRIRTPSWISIEAPGQAPVRLTVERAARADAPAAAFGTDWLQAP